MVMDCSLGIHLSAPCCRESHSCNVKNASSCSSERLEACNRLSRSGTEGLKWKWLQSGAFKEVSSESLFDGEHPDYHLHPCSIWAGLAAIQVFESVCGTTCLINGSADFTCVVKKMCIAAEGMESKGVKWNIHRRMLIDGFIMWEQMWP